MFFDALHINTQWTLLQSVLGSIATTCSGKKSMLHSITFVVKTVYNNSARRVQPWHLFVKYITLRNEAYTIVT